MRCGGASLRDPLLRDCVGSQVWTPKGYELDFYERLRGDTGRGSIRFSPRPFDNRFGWTRFRIITSV